ncbi:hypothetical protein [Streptomyces sp. LUP30]|nr:hypothetical protein [Streptomyces sp. LUP30]
MTLVARLWPSRRFRRSAVPDALHLSPVAVAVAVIVTSSKGFFAMA